MAKDSQSPLLIHESLNEGFVWLVIGIVLGIFINLALGKFFEKDKKKKPKQTQNSQELEGSEWDSESESEDEYVSSLVGDSATQKIPDKELFEKFPIIDVKQVLVVRDDLKMGKGKIGAQCGHATLGSFRACHKQMKGSKYWTKVYEKWQWGGQKKICVKVQGEDALIQVKQMADKLGIPNYLVADAGHTQIAAGSLTVCGIGPVESAHVHAITGDKKLL